MIIPMTVTNYRGNLQLLFHPQVLQNQIFFKTKLLKAKINHIDIHLFNLIKQVSYKYLQINN